MESNGLFSTGLG